MYVRRYFVLFELGMCSSVFSSPFSFPLFPFLPFIFVLSLLSSSFFPCPLTWPGLAWPGLDRTDLDRPGPDRKIGRINQTIRRTAQAPNHPAYQLIDSPTHQPLTLLTHPLHLQTSKTPLPRPCTVHMYPPDPDPRRDIRMLTLRIHDIT